ncbi:MAG: hypothetical protein M1383_02210 [Patescibacteria group bacterium]|nr:hypothetical protein [Patescibacteria group bacterium]
MPKQPKIFWLPRATGILFVLFLSLFALDVFEGSSGWGTVAALLVHLLPALVLLAAIIISWKHAWTGAAAFFAFAACYVFLAGLHRPWQWYAFIPFPAVVIGIFFLADNRAAKPHGAS